MTRSIRFVAAAIAIVAAVFATHTRAAPLEIAGEVTYRERIALPPEALLSIQLVDVSLDGEPARIGAEATIEGPGQVPLQFVLSFDDEVLLDGHDYALVATIWAGEHVWFRNLVPHPVDPRAGLPSVVIVNFVGEVIDPDAPPQPQVRGDDVAVVTPVEPAELEVSAEIFDTIWLVGGLSGSVLLESPRLTLSITTDRRAGGVAGCNNYFAEAYFDGPELSFGDIVSTRMACGDPVMDQESAYFAALTSVRGYEVEDGALYLLDTDGNQLLALTKALAD